MVLRESGGSPDAAALSCLFPYTGEVRPKYQIVTVVYAPPGTSSGKSTSQVEYGAASTLGTTTSNTNSFKSGVGVSASVTFLGSAGGSIKGNGVCPQNKSIIVWCDGVQWVGSVSA